MVTYFAPSNSYTHNNRAFNYLPNNGSSYYTRSVKATNGKSNTAYPTTTSPTAGPTEPPSTFSPTTFSPTTSSPTSAYPTANPSTFIPTLTPTSPPITTLPTAAPTFPPPPPPSLPPRPSPPPSPSPPPPSIYITTSENSVGNTLTTYAQGNSSFTCIRTMLPVGVENVSLSTTAGPSSLSWIAEHTDMCDTTICTLDLCGFEVGEYNVSGIVRFKSSTGVPVTNVWGHVIVYAAPPPPAPPPPSPPPPAHPSPPTPLPWPPPPPSPPPPPCPPPGTVVVAGVSSIITFASLSLFAFDDPSFDESFTRDFSIQMAAAAGVTPFDLVVISITGGSVSVSSVVYFASSATSTPELFRSTISSSPSSIFTFAHFAAYAKITSSFISTSSYEMVYSPPPHRRLHHPWHPLFLQDPLKPSSKPPSPPRPPSLPLPPPPTIHVSLGDFMTAYYQGSANGTCIRVVALQNCSVDHIYVQSLGGPNNLSWTFAGRSVCDKAGCTLDMCGFTVGDFLLSGTVTFSASMGLPPSTLNGTLTIYETPPPPSPPTNPPPPLPFSLPISPLPPLCPPLLQTPPPVAYAASPLPLRNSTPVSSDLPSVNGNASHNESTNQHVAASNHSSHGADLAPGFPNASSSSTSTSAPYEDVLLRCDEHMSYTNHNPPAECNRGCPEGTSGSMATYCLPITSCDRDNGGCDLLTTCNNKQAEDSASVEQLCGECPEGYAGSGTTGCVDDDGCQIGSGVDACDGAQCIDVPAPGTGYVCSPCPPGMLGNGVTCQENYCPASGSGFGGCDPMVACTMDGRTNTAVCGACPSGLELAETSSNRAEASGQRCAEIDGCAKQPCWSNGSAIQTCEDIPAPGIGRICGDCPAGFRAAADRDDGCTDVDECQELPNGGCWLSDEVPGLRTSCINTRGSFQCSPCPQVRAH
ncbi:hypothetical protein CYMTET_14889 [Cymbomonas tetramitiformis]|uniref:EGF-like domain-containing protein n=1 Tax=Cymbomonas tetramitiformis TaxID=36881 RepID=A0AAE0GFD5_9CHLO|nr:hypothetical protein CYMTET_14889 [Cymbomonas tetramitiformis]